MNYREIIIYLFLLMIIFIQYRNVNNFKKKRADLYKSMSRYKAYYAACNQWMKNRNDNKVITEYFKEKNINKIAIYGLGELGNRFYEEIKDSDLKVTHFIDKNACKNEGNKDGIPVIHPVAIKDLQEVDVIVVTPIYDFDDIEEDLLTLNIELKIISLEDAIFETEV